MTEKFNFLLLMRNERWENIRCASASHVCLLILCIYGEGRSTWGQRVRKRGRKRRRRWRLKSYGRRGRKENKRDVSSSFFYNHSLPTYFPTSSPKGGHTNNKVQGLNSFKFDSGVILLIDFVFLLLINF